MRSLSSGWAFIYKFVFPIFWILVMGLAVVYGLSFLWVHGKGPDLDILLEILAPWIIGPLMIIYGLRLKEVRMDDDFLYISNYLREEKVPLTQVASVGQGFIGRNSSVKVRFSEETAFGRSVLFLPQAEFRIFFGIWEHPVVDQIGMAVYRAKARKK